MNENTVKLLQEAKTLLIVVGKNTRLDGVAAALGLSLAATSQGKSARVCTELNLPESGRLVGSDKISPTLELGGNVLKVSFPYRDGAIDKVTYNITDDTFNLLIEPRTGTAPLESKDVHYAYTGGTVDVIVTIDAPNLESLGSIYLDNPDVFVADKIINIDRRFDNKNYGAENIVDKQASSTSELVAQLLNLLRWNINPDVATDLYAGLSAATNNFTSFSTNASSFEAASMLLKSGARKAPPTAPQNSGAPRPPMGFPGAGVGRGMNPAGGFGGMNSSMDPFGGFNAGGNPFMDEDDDDFDDMTPMSQVAQPQQQAPVAQPPRVNMPQQTIQPTQQRPVGQQQPQQRYPQPQQHSSHQQRPHEHNRPQQQPQQQNQQGDSLKPKIFKGPSVS